MYDRLADGACSRVDMSVEVRMLWFGGGSEACEPGYFGLDCDICQRNTFASGGVPVLYSDAVKQVDLRIGRRPVHECPSGTYRADDDKCELSRDSTRRPALACTSCDVGYSSPPEQERVTSAAGDTEALATTRASSVTPGPRGRFG